MIIIDPSGLQGILLPISMYMANTKSDKNCFSLNVKYDKIYINLHINCGNNLLRIFKLSW